MAILYQLITPSFQNQVFLADGSFPDQAPGVSNSSQNKENLPQESDNEIPPPYIFLSKTSGNHDVITSLPHDVTPNCFVREILKKGEGERKEDNFAIDFEKDDLKDDIRKMAGVKDDRCAPTPNCYSREGEI